MLTEAQREGFERTGLVRLAGAIPAADTAPNCLDQPRMMATTMIRRGA